MKKNNDSEASKPGQPLIDSLIHAPARFKIMSNLYLVGWVDFLFLQNLTGLTRGNLSSHLTRLEKAEYVLIKKEFIGKISHTTISMSDKGHKAFNIYRENLKKLLEDIPE